MNFRAKFEGDTDVGKLPNRNQSSAYMSRRTLTLVALVAVIFLCAVCIFVFDENQSAASISHETNTERFANAIEMKAEISDDLSDHQQPSSSSLINAEPDASNGLRGSGIDGSASSAPSFEERPDTTGKSEDSSAADVELVRNPFPISLSVRDSCKQISHLGTASCADIYALIEQLQKEPRDKQWAESMEQIIRGLVSTQPGYSVRALDCRTTVCAVEVESTHGVFRPDKHALQGKLDWVDQNYGYEVNSNKERVKVTLVALQRE